MNSFHFHSVPPAGIKIPITAIARSIKKKRKNPAANLLEGLGNLLGTGYTLYLSSGRAALWLILKALSNINPKKRDVIIPAYTCPAIISALLKADLRPVLCDMNDADFGFSSQEFQQKINRNTLAVIVVHLFGYPANIEEVKGYCKANNVFVVEDAAQAFGNSVVNSPDKKLGLLGDVGFFSFGRGKPLSIGHGGILATNSESIFMEAEKIFKKFNHHNGYDDPRFLLTLVSYSVLSNPYLYWIPQKMPFLNLGKTIFVPDFDVSRGTDIAASLILELVSTLETEKRIRRKNAEWYYKDLHNLPFVEGAPDAGFPYLRYPLIVKERKVRDLILDRLVSRGTGAALFYPTPLNELPGLKEILGDNTVYPVAKKLSETLITLPVHSGVTPSNRERIVTLIKNSVY